MTVYDRPFGRYLEDFVPGDIYRHWPGKTITEYDDHLFCMITMNHHPLHTNAWFAENETVQGKNVVVGNLVYSLVLGEPVVGVGRVVVHRDHAEEVVVGLGDRLARPVPVDVPDLEILQISAERPIMNRHVTPLRVLVRVSLDAEPRPPVEGRDTPEEVQPP